MRVPSFLRRRASGLILLFDLAALAVFFVLIPQMRRPFEALMAVLFCLGVLSVAVIRNRAARNLSLVVVVVAATVFGLEMAEKKWEITGLLDDPPRETPGAARSGAAGNGGGTGAPAYRWNAHSTAQYLAVKDRARADGLDPEALADRFAGDVFVAAGRKPGWVSKTRSGGKAVSWEGLKEIYVHGEPLGYELAPDNIIRHRCRDLDSGRTVSDACYRVNAAGFRETRGDPDGDVHVFLGCSLTFGFGLSDDETLPHHFSEAGGFRHRVLNLGVNDYGPHQALRDLQLDMHLGRAGVDPSRVKSVVFTFFDDHARRAESPHYPGAPRFVLEGGVLRHAGVVENSFVGGRLAMLADRGRIYPALRARILARRGAAGDEYRWNLVHAILEEIDRICRERYGVGMTVVYWNNDPRVRERFSRAGIDHVCVDDVFEADWRRYFIKYGIYDGHPSSYANRLLGRHLAGMLLTDGASERAKSD